MSDQEKTKTIPFAALEVFLQDQIEDCEARMKRSAIPDLSTEKIERQAYEKVLRYIRRLKG